MAYEIKLLELPNQPTLVMHDVLPVEKLPEFFGKAFGGIMAYLGELGEQPVGMPFGAYHNLDMTALDVEAGFPVARNLTAGVRLIRRHTGRQIYLNHSCGHL